MRQVTEQQLREVNDAISAKYAGREASEHLRKTIQQDAELMLGVPVEIHEDGEGWRTLTVVVDPAPVTLVLRMVGAADVLTRTTREAIEAGLQFARDSDAELKVIQLDGTAIGVLPGAVERIDEVPSDDLI